MIALYRALGARYDADTYFEGIATEETTLSLNNVSKPVGYSDTALQQQYIPFTNAVRSSMPRANLVLFTNWLGFDRVMGEHAEADQRLRVQHHPTRRREAA